MYELGVIWPLISRGLALARVLSVLGAEEDARERLEIMREAAAELPIASANDNWPRPQKLWHK